MTDRDPPPKESWIPALLCGGCGLMVGIALFVSIGIPLLFALSGPCVDIHTGERATCSNGGPLLFWLVVLSVPGMAVLGAMLPRLLRDRLRD